MAVLTERPELTPRTDRRSPLRGLAVALLVANVGIILTGGLVRLTASGLGCPTWPRCDATSYTTHPALGIHGAIEFGNRLLTFVLLLIALATVVAALLHRENGRARIGVFWLSVGLLLGIPLQGVVGGISVLTHLNPFVVALHLILSMVLVALSVWLVRLTWHAERRRVATGPFVGTKLTWAAMWLTVWLGTIVTGSGPHAGDATAPRTGFDGILVTQLHAAAVTVTVVLAVVCLVQIRSRAAVLLLVVLLAQAAVGITQYYLGVPIGLVLLHLLGAAAAIVVATNLALSVTRRTSTVRMCDPQLTTDRPPPTPRFPRLPPRLCDRSLHFASAAADAK